MRRNVSTANRAHGDGTLPIVIINVDRKISIRMKQLGKGGKLADDV